MRETMSIVKHNKQVQEELAEQEGLKNAILLSNGGKAFLRVISDNMSPEEFLTKYNIDIPISIIRPTGDRLLTYLYNNPPQHKIVIIVLDNNTSDKMLETMSSQVSEYGMVILWGSYNTVFFELTRLADWATCIGRITGGYDIDLYPMEDNVCEVLWGDSD